MHRVDTDTAQVDKFGAGKNGFTGGTPPLVPPTIPGHEIFDAIQEEIVSVIDFADITLVKGTHTQLRDAVVTIAARAALRVGTHFLSTLHALSGVTSTGAVTWWPGAGLPFPGGGLLSRLHKPADGCGLAWEIPIPVGAVLTAIRASVIPGVGRTLGAQMEFQLYQQDLTTMAYAPATGVLEELDAGGTSLQWISLTLPGGGIVGSAGTRYFAIVLPGISGAADAACGVEYTTALV